MLIFMLQTYKHPPGHMLVQGGVCVLQTIPWRMILWIGAALVALYYIGWAVFGPPRRARVLLINGVSGLAAAWAAGLLGSAFGTTLHINLLTVACSALLGIPGAALVCVLQLVGG